jgi:Carbohydrate esterase, sialic acid-specific acetylesterase
VDKNLVYPSVGSATGVLSRAGTAIGQIGRPGPARAGLSRLKRTGLLYGEEPPTTGTIAITTPIQYQFYQRTGDTNGIGGTGSIPITGTYTGSPSAIEASFNGGAYSTIAGSPSAGSYSGTLSGQSAGQGTLTVRFANDHTVTASVTVISICDVFVIYGQSNASGRGNNNQVYSGSVQGLLYGNNNVFQVLTDPTDSSVGQTSDGNDAGAEGGSVWPLVATYISAYTGVPTAWIPAAIGGTGIVFLQSRGGGATDTTQYYGTMVYRTGSNTTPSNGAIGCGCGGVRMVYWWQGETDAQSGMDQPTYYGDFTTLTGTIKADVGCKTMPCKLQLCADAPTAAGEPAINAAIGQAWANDANTIPGPDLSDMSTAPDSFHLKTDTQLATAAYRWWQATLIGLYGGSLGTPSGNGSIFYPNFVSGPTKAVAAGWV